MEKMTGHPRLFRRGARYYHRAAIPVDIKDSYGKTEETFSLGTTDYQEAVRKVRIEAVRVDALFDRHRAEIKKLSIPALKVLPPDEIKRIGAIYYAHLLEEDDEARMFDGFGAEDKSTIEIKSGDDVEAIFDEHAFRRPSFEQSVAEHEESVSSTKMAYARGDTSVFFDDEVEEVLSWDGINIDLDRSSIAWTRMARELQISYMRAQKSIGQRYQGEIVETPTPSSTGSVQRLTSGTSSAPLLSAASKEWIAEKYRASWTEKTKKEHEIWMAHFIQVIGNRSIDQYSKADARSFKGILMKLPANWKSYGDINHLKQIDKVSDKAHSIGLPPMSDKNMNKLLGYIGSFWRWAENNYDWSSGNIFGGLKVIIKTRARDDRDPFTVREMNIIFRAPLYSGCKSLHHWKQVGDVVPRDSGKFWVPLIALFTGARNGEIIQLFTTDIKHNEDGIHYFDMNEETDEKSLKTAGSSRLVPVHPMLIELGFLDHMRLRLDNNDLRLFPDLERGADGYYSSVFGKFFNRAFLENIKVKHKKNSFHSFRHSFEDACRDSDIPKEIMDAFQGHVSNDMSGRYGSGYKLSKLNEWMQRLEYKGLDLKHLTP